jgi:hypothetical protein
MATPLLGTQNYRAPNSGVSRRPILCPAASGIPHQVWLTSRTEPIGGYGLLIQNSSILSLAQNENKINKKMMPFIKLLISI